MFVAFACLAGCRDAKPQPTVTADDVAATATSEPVEGMPAADLEAKIGVRASLPAADAADLASRYGRTAGRAASSKPFAGEQRAGDTRAFSVLRLTAATFSRQSPPEVDTIRATLIATSAHAYFYEDDAISYDRAGVDEAAQRFEAGVWPAVTSAFGEPPAPGVDGDPRIIVLQADLGGAVGGYFSSDDTYLRSVRPLSNEAEMVYIDHTMRAGGAAFDVTLAHEFQHLIHWRNDATEEAWANEGLSEDASGLAGGAVSSIDAFAAHPSTQLTTFDLENAFPHYGAGAAFFRYLASRFGGDTSFGGIARAQGNGAAGVDEFLQGRGERLRFRDVFADWMAANILNAESGPFANPARPVEARIDDGLAAGDQRDGEATQFGTDYYRLGLAGGEGVVRFAGSTEVPILPASAANFRPAVWSNAEDSIDTTLTHEVDLSDAVAPVLRFRTWYDIERWFDWGQVAVSVDGGATWQALAGDHTTSDDPLQVAYGAGYTGRSGGGSEAQWIEERVDLSRFAGRTIKLRFEYITDLGTHGEGWLTDDVAVEGSGFRDQDISDPGWISDGWLRVDRPLRQTYAVRLIVKQRDGTSSVTDVPLDSANRGELRFSADGVGQAVLAIAGTTEGTNQKSAYHLEIASP